MLADKQATQQRLVSCLLLLLKPLGSAMPMAIPELIEESE